MYMWLCGIFWKDEVWVVKWVLEKLELIKYVDKLVGIYSGGNKWKFFMVIVFIGYLVFIFLDEFIIGMDFKVWCFFWNFIFDFIKIGCLVVLILYSMEECEVLCMWLVIMVNGCLWCLGSI